VRINLYVGKKEGVDCSGSGKGVYSFRLNEISISGGGTPPNVMDLLELESYSLNRGMGTTAGLHGWRFRSRNTTYQHILTDQELKVLAEFDGGPDEVEEVVLHRDLEPVDLRYYPVFNINYYVDDPDVQTIRLRFGIDTTGDGKVDRYVPDIFPYPAAGKYSDLDINILHRARNEFPSSRRFILLAIDMSLTKLPGTDCRAKDVNIKERDMGSLKGVYGFHIRGIRLKRAGSLSGQKSYVLRDNFDIPGSEIKKVRRINGWDVKPYGVLWTSATGVWAEGGKG